MNLEQIEKVQKMYQHYDFAMLTQTIADIAMNFYDTDDMRLEIFKLHTLVKLLDEQYRRDW